MPDRAKDLSGKSIKSTRALTLALAVAAVTSVGLGRPGLVFADSQPTILLYPSSIDDNSAYKQLIDIRTRLRADGRFLVISYDPDAPSVIRAANDAGHPEWLKDEPSSALDQLAFARAIGASFYAVISADRSGRKADVHLVETASTARMWDIDGKSGKDAAGSLEDQANTVLAHPSVAPELVPIAPPPNITQEAPAIAPATPPPANPQTQVTPPPAAPEPVIPAPAAPPPAVVQPPATPSPVQTPDTTAAPDFTSPTPQVDTSGTSSATEASLLSEADDDVTRGDVASAIAIYKQAINASPLEVAPRLHLAKAYLAGGLRDMALDEARRALVMDPNNVPVQQFLLHIDEQSGNSDGAIARNKALVDRNSTDSAAHIGLGDAFWNNNDLVSAEQEYKTAIHLSAPGDVSAVGHLARLYAAGGRYSDSLKVLKDAGSGVDIYEIALQIIQGRADELSAKLDTARDSFQAGDSTREAFYDTAKGASTQINALSDFANAITPPKPFQVSHLHRIQGVDLLAQEAAIYVSFIETSNADDGQKAMDLEKASQTEMLTAHATEERGGLWKDRD